MMFRNVHLGDKTLMKNDKLIIMTIKIIAVLVKGSI